MRGTFDCQGGQLLRIYRCKPDVLPENDGSSELE